MKESDTDIKFNPGLLFWSFFTMIDHAHQPHHRSDDLQPPFSRETYANTLAMRAFCALAAMIYPANALRIDIAHPTSLLARFMQNPSPIHVTKADHLITYLRDRKWLSLVVDGNTGLSGGSIKVFEGSSDAFYNTEAELLAFTHAD